MPFPPQIIWIRTMCEELRSVALHRIYSEGRFKACASIEAWYNPIDALIIWYDGATVSQSESHCLLSLREVP